MVVKHTWGMHRVYFHDGTGDLVGIPAPWTSVVAPDPWLVVAEGRSHFRIDDLLQLRKLIEEIGARRPRRRRAKRGR